MLRRKSDEGHFMKTTTACAPLLERTQYLVNNAPRHITYTIMAKEIGCSIAWISRFAANNIPDPGVKLVQALHDYLDGLTSEG